MWELLTAPILPHEYAPLAQRFVERLDELGRLNVPDIDMAGAAERARVLLNLTTRLDAAARDWRARPGGGDMEQAATVLNQAMLSLARTLIPIAATTVGAYGQDRYGHAWQPEMVPSLAPYPKLAGYPRDSEAFQTWWVAMVRARNRAADALERAGEIARDALETLGR